MRIQGIIIIIIIKSSGEEEKKKKKNTYVYMSIDIAIRLTILRSRYDIKTTTTTRRRKKNNIPMWREMGDILIVVTSKYESSCWIKKASVPFLYIWMTEDDLVENSSHKTVRCFLLRLTSPSVRVRALLRDG